MACRSTYTLLELMVVLMILSTFLYIISFSRVIVTRSRDEGARLALNSLRAAVNLYFLNHHGVYPKTLGELEGLYLANRRDRWEGYAGRGGFTYNPETGEVRLNPDISHGQLDRWGKPYAGY